MACDERWYVLLNFKCLYTENAIKQWLRNYNVQVFENSVVDLGYKDKKTIVAFQVDSVSELLEAVRGRPDITYKITAANSEEEFCSKHNAVEELSSTSEPGEYFLWEEETTAMEDKELHRAAINTPTQKAKSLFNTPMLDEELGPVLVDWAKKNKVNKQKAKRYAAIYGLIEEYWK